MVRLVNGECIQATVRDTFGQSDKRKCIIQLHPNKTVEEVYTEVALEFSYDPNTIELMLQNNRIGTPLILNQFKDRTLREAGVVFIEDSSTTIIINQLRVKCVSTNVQQQQQQQEKQQQEQQGGVMYEDDLLLGASASPTSMDVTAPSMDAVDAAALPAIEYYTQSAGHSSKDNRPIHEPCNYVGLVNQAMTCYLNSLLQALYMTPEFRNALYNWEFDGSNPDNSIPFQLQRLFLKLQTSSKSAVETTDLTHSFGWNMQQAWEQHDIQELCRVMFDALEQKFKDTKQANLINDLYEGKMLDYVKCLECSTEKSREDTFQDIPLPVRPFGSTVAYNSVEEALRAFVQPETLDGNNQYHCEKCNKKCDAHKGLKFTKFPYLLTLHLKRFDFDYSLMNRIKLNDKVVFPEVLNLNSFITGANAMSDENAEEVVVKCDDCSTTDSGSALDDESCQGTDVSSTVRSPYESSQEDDEGIDVSSGNNLHENEKNRLQEPTGPYNYELFSIMIHSGSASGGHYYAYIKDFAKNQWFCFNDQSVNRLTEDDIRKTYGGGPQRSYYSGAYSSSTNAYMLMYRQIDKDRNCAALTMDDFPSHIKKLLQDMRDKEEADRIKKEKENETFKIKVYAHHPVSNAFMSDRLFVTVETTLEETVSDVYWLFKLKGIVNIPDCRLVAYNNTMESIEYSFTNNDIYLGEIGKKCTEFYLQIKKPDAVFEDYKVGGVNVKLFMVHLLSDEVDNPKNIWINPGTTVGELRKRICTDYELETLHMVLEKSFNSTLQYLDDDNFVFQFDSICHGYKLYVSRFIDMEEGDLTFGNSKLAKIIERFKYIISFDVSLPDVDINTLEQLSIPQLDSNQNLEKIETGSGDRASNSSSLRVSPQPAIPGCEMFSDQSNSEDSSLSDSDRTLVGDAPGDEIGILSTSWNSPDDALSDVYPNIHKVLNWDDQSASAGLETAEESTKSTDGDNPYFLVCDEATPNYYFRAVNLERNQGEQRSCRVMVDKRMQLGNFKKCMEPLVGVSVEYFKLYQVFPNHTAEWLSLTETLDFIFIKNSEQLTIKLGRVLKSNEVSGKIFLLEPNAAEPITLWFEWIIAEDQLVGAVKREILLQAKKLFMTDIPPNKCRLRKKSIKNPSTVYLDENKFTQNITVNNNFEMFIQEVSDDSEKTDASQLLLFVRHWQPSKLVLGPIQEVLLQEATMTNFKKAVSHKSGIPMEFLEVAMMKSSFPCDMNVLGVQTKVDWTPDKHLIDNFSIEVYEDGSLFYYRDSREVLKEISMDERKELYQSENKRLGKFSTKSYSPRRERGLKIYVDTSPKKEDEPFLD
ncbi:PREDICTED: ubiquitin carboxyl-terminal hydrolase 47 isoform X2 [Nicrophorus vespilloides]|nr:PREDICTED: ubiquitin carboxyl-terminal hydrolase 47 isoform X2 [Nicrophorus vespilloides]XP_017780461.1 PREDICTED: ubiquitin carboxyl-terminal hydrolase 47 isoform X2 [Nicrophorus vespilloides]XP_017780462.1 PREDICTED: ubiquitin carboxyl-terminal hydrolase 47 isoform X2 [Nicrophorus vespilloides]XP_017780463.1 PREDICTED: ubiquitin carboxyl-terminal hydrolase 47 isoform X2 [Nicrophorus vespilloides]